MKTIRGRFRAAVLMGAAASVLAFAAGAKAQNHMTDSTNDNTWPYATTGKSPVLAVVGDISCQPGDGGAVRLRMKSAPTPQPPLHQHLSVAIPGGHCESD